VCTRVVVFMPLYIMRNVMLIIMEMFVSKTQFTTSSVQLLLSHFHKVSQQYNARLHKQTARKMSKLLRLCQGKD